MKQRIWFLAVAFAFTLVTICLPACRSTQAPVKFYTLDAMQGLEKGSLQAAANREVAVGVGPVRLPALLERPQIVIRTSPNMVNLSESHRWGGSLREDFLRVIGENISQLLGTSKVAVYPWESYFTPDYRVAFDVQRFDGELAGNVVLSVSWTVRGREATGVLAVKNSVVREPVAASSYEALVAAESRALAALSQQVVEQIKQLEIARAQ
ncbi:MAG: membrane integrity-associated transporter subunit PqiC [Deltaproteobacteria bacterium]|nr:membrane integrity-associated transporter subunit PqiC [Deltaproteobacteria bacterium]MBW2070450.1 membrane integrity-associated transporter subunit PqiC [Deltaproteobacteria bacterium]